MKRTIEQVFCDKTGRELKSGEYVTIQIPRGVKRATEVHIANNALVAVIYDLIGRLPTPDIETWLKEMNSQRVKTTLAEMAHETMVKSPVDTEHCYIDGGGAARYQERLEFGGQVRQE